jgi:hypothetical protein
MSHKDRLPDLVHKGITFKVETMRDEGHEAPWEDDDGRGVVTDWLNIDADTADAAKLRQLGHEERDGSARYFDVAATRAKAKAEGWGLSDEDRAKLPKHATKAQILDAIVEGEYRFLNGWCSNEWEYIGVIVTLPGTGIDASLWGIESNSGDYLQEVARDLADQIIGDPETQRRLRATEARTRELLGQVQDVLAEEDRKVVQP